MLRNTLLTVCLATAAQLAHAGEAGKVIFVAGSATAAERALKVGLPVNEGEMLSTGADGYIYIKTLDNGLFILRPNTRARIVNYHVDAKNPSNTRIKLELLNGVARSQSGSAVKLARQNFRFNTPVAAIGVRGTDFTVFTSAEVSRVAVISGGITMSGFSGGCRPEGTGPCEGAASRELSAAQRGQLLEIERGQAAAQLKTGGTLAPDVVAPPRQDEPVVKAAAPAPAPVPPVAAAPSTPILDPIKAVNVTPPVVTPPVVTPPTAPVTPPVIPPPVIVEVPPVTPPVVTPPVVTPPEVTPPEVTPPVVVVPVPEVPVPPPVVVVPPPVVVVPPEVTIPPVVVVPEPPVVVPVVERAIVWGRYQPLLGQAAKVDLAAETAAKAQRVSLKGYYAVLRSTVGEEYVTPERGSVAFSLRDGEAYILSDNPTVNPLKAGLENGLLNFDFDKKKFATSFDIVSNSERIKMMGTGSVAKDGRFSIDNQYAPGNNMQADGVLSRADGGTAAYTFQGRITEGRTVNGVTYWGTAAR